MIYWIDLFCGAGGVTTGINMTDSSRVIACVNHDDKAIRKDGKALFRLYHYYLTHNESVIIDFMSVDRSVWNRGIGSGILETAKKVAAHMNKRLALYTKPNLVGWYEKRGFVVTNDEVEGVPDHVWMEYNNEES